MEYMKLDGFLGKQLSKLLNKALASKFGVNPKLDIREFTFSSTVDGLVKVQLSAEMPQKEFEAIIEEVTG